MINFFISISTSKKTQMHKKVQCTERHCNYQFFNHDDDSKEVKVYFFFNSLLEQILQSKNPLNIATIFIPFHTVCRNKNSMQGFLCLGR